jgi:hypothetical protein
MSRDRGRELDKEGGMAIKVEAWKMPTRHGEAIQELFRNTESSSGGGLVVLLPGQAYPCDRPLLYYARLTALQAGLDVLALEYGYQRADAPADDIPVLAEEAERAIRWAGGEGRGTRLVGKSLGTAVAADLSERGGWWSAVQSLLLTPLPRAMALIAAGRAEAVIGTLDPLFGEPSIRESRERWPKAWTILPGTDHGLEAPGHVDQSLWALQVTVDTVRAFLEGR